MGKWRTFFSVLILFQAAFDVEANEQSSRPVSQAPMKKHYRNFALLSLEELKQYNAHSQAQLKCSRGVIKNMRKCQRHETKMKALEELMASRSTQFNNQGNSKKALNPQGSQQTVSCDFTKQIKKDCKDSVCRDLNAQLAKIQADCDIAHAKCQDAISELYRHKEDMGRQIENNPNFCDSPVAVGVATDACDNTVPFSQGHNQIREQLHMLMGDKPINQSHTVQAVYESSAEYINSMVRQKCDNIRAASKQNKQTPNRGTASALGNAN